MRQSDQFCKQSQQDSVVRLYPSKYLQYLRPGYPIPLFIFVIETPVVLRSNIMINPQNPYYLPLRSIVATTNSKKPFHLSRLYSSLVLHFLLSPTFLNLKSLHLCLVARPLGRFPFGFHIVAIPISPPDFRTRPAPAQSDYSRRLASIIPKSLHF